MASPVSLPRFARTPSGRELALFGVAYLLYSLGRFVAIGDHDVAVANAGSIVDLEQALSADVEQSVQSALQGSWLLPIYALFPCAPPRLADVGLVDTITTQTGLALDSKLRTSFYNPLAAVPSLHAGFALAVSAALAAATSRRSLQVLAWLWAPTIGLAVVATGNHFVFDIAAGAVVTVAGHGLGRLVAAGRMPALQAPQERAASAYI